MTKLGAAFWLGLVLVSGFTTFKVKYAVQDIDDQLARLRKQDLAEQQEIRVLNAEWTYLNQPERLAELNKRFLQLVPVTAKQLQQKIEDIALRPPPPPPEPVFAVAAPAPAPTPALAPAASAPTAPTPVASAAAAATPRAVAAVFARAAAQAAPLLPVRIATAEAAPASAGAPAAASLDALFAQVAERR